MRSHLSLNFSRTVLASMALIWSMALPLVAQAQLYTWKDPQGNPIIKNSPPPWFSEPSGLRGARVQVIRNGKVIDDTAWPSEKRQDGQNTGARDEAKRAQSEAAAGVGKKPATD